MWISPFKLVGCGIAWQKEDITNNIHMIGSGHIADYLNMWKTCQKLSTRLGGNELVVNQNVFLLTIKQWGWWQTRQKEVQTDSKYMGGYSNDLSAALQKKVFANTCRNAPSNA